LFERPRNGERAVLVRIDFPSDGGNDDLEEFHDLVVSAGACPVATIMGTRRAPDAKYFIGLGKLEEVEDRVAELGAQVVILDHALSPAQERNLEARLGCRVLDRITLILDIFAQRASTAEGKLQVELAQLRHLSTRLVRGWTHLERQKGGIGLRGPGEKQLETDRRLVADRIRSIERRLERVRRRRELSRRSRRKADIPVIALVGYTNAGKSTLFNRLTGARVSTADRLFATLDPTLRRVRGESGERLIFADTVGFIRDLPHELVAAFRATLEETRRATMLLHVVDASDPDRQAKIHQVNEVLEEIGAGDIPQIEVFNKIDACEAAEASGNGHGGTVQPRLERNRHGRVCRVWVSAALPAGMDLLLDAVASRFRAATVHRQVRVPASAGRLRAKLFEMGAVRGECTVENGDWLMDVEIGEESLARLWHREGLSPALIGAVAPPAS
jgi:GTP-binding protein HflX